MGLAICSATIDWAATGTMLQGIGTLAGACAVAWAANKGADTFDAWRTQKLTERKMDQAEKILTATHDAREALQLVRREIIYGYEKHEAEKILQEMNGWQEMPTEARNFLTLQMIYQTRLQNKSNEFSKLNKIRTMSHALFGSALDAAISHILMIYECLINKAGAYNEGLSAEVRKQVYEAMFAVKTQDGQVNEVTAAIEAAVATIERTCLRVLRLEAGTAAS